ncbi:TerC family protein [Pelobacter propionicus]|uniref:Integral membrane protein TerC n=1 Tax=Pelobacter propionicus (strain DSM 2379 / NBRC 103807 / OttBd1) TaxID=338966 RepID=A1AUY9_PELPD|nr:TerC family protein [Pelobacter propionicus]ABL01160.1 Integral membrane protein TerC [Pelobacter propionicus DSM 2379]
MTETTIMWTVFTLLFGAMLVVDLGLNRKSHEVSFREALTWSMVWIALALAFNMGIYMTMGSAKALEFFSGYVIEKSLSVDNLFVFIMIFSYFGVRGHHQARILKWGIIGALVMRAIFIFAGVGLLARFHWLFYLFGALLVVTAFKMAFGGEGKVEPEKNLMVRAIRKLLPVTRRTWGDWFITRRRGMVVASPLLVTLLMIEWSDLVFAIDSIPAIFAITLDPFIVFTSNIFAIMGLRALYFLLANVMEMFAYLKFGISFILLFVGGKMIAAASGFHIPITVSLTVIFLSLAVAVLASLFFGPRQREGVPANV